MRRIIFALLVMMGSGVAGANDFLIPYSIINAPVTHSGKFHILNNKRTCIILDGSKGMSFSIIRQAPSKEIGFKDNAVILNASFQVELNLKGQTILLDQAFDPNPRLQIISQGPTHVAARVFFSMCSLNRHPYGTGTLDIYLCDERIHLVPSLYIDYLSPAAWITRAGFAAEFPEKLNKLAVKGKTISSEERIYFESFGNQKDDFHLTIFGEGSASVKIGWLRNLYPRFSYLREVDRNPEIDELYEKWPPWISQRGYPLGWKMNKSSGFEASFSKSGLKNLSLLWVNKEPTEIPEGAYQSFNGIMAIFLGKTRDNTEMLWENFKNPVKPIVQKGNFRFYNEIEGIYEVDSQAGDVDLTFDCAREMADRPIVLRLWNLKGKGAYVIRVNDEPIPFSLMNDGDLIDDPMVFIVKEASGPANLALVSFAATKGKKSRLTMVRRPGLQFTYEMYSALETYEAWSEQCSDKPLFRFHLQNGSIYHATLPGKSDYAFFKLPLYWMKNGVNPATFMNHVRRFQIEENGPENIRFTLAGVNLQGTGLSTYTCLVPYETGKITFDIKAEFIPLDDGRRWTELEYCDLYPFESVYRRNFHYRDVSFLTEEGFFDRVGAGAWDHKFRTVLEPERLGYYSEYVKREGPGSKVPDVSDGSVWILGNNTERGNILFRRGDFELSEGTTPVFTLCNAWVDIHNSLSNRKKRASRERINFTVEVFRGYVPALEKLNSIYLKAAGEKKVKKIKSVKFSKKGKIQGFIFERNKKEDT
jgi:hypothetical protein